MFSHFNLLTLLIYFNVRNVEADNVNPLLFTMEDIMIFTIVLLLKILLKKTEEELLVSNLAILATKVLSEVFSTQKLTRPKHAYSLNNAGTF